MRIDGLVHGAPLCPSRFWPWHQVIYDIAGGFVRHVLAPRQVPAAGDMPHGDN
ncbi:hypothetical protein [Nocardia neocaledoniensis]|uniref:hypothetical protein n=1 Tax=Nocardia neocaledoniensis TaxID=236511 RepID=UPI002458658D|nr:hypothetical protein [Nocardia neocaledoniensis]